MLNSPRLPIASLTAILLGERARHRVFARDGLRRYALLLALQRLVVPAMTGLRRLRIVSRGTRSRVGRTQVRARRSSRASLRRNRRKRFRDRRRSGWNVSRATPTATASVTTATTSVTTLAALTSVWARRRFGPGSGCRRVSAFARLAHLSPALFEHLLTFDNCVSHLRCEEPDCAKRVIVARHDIVYAVRIAVRVNYRDSSDAKLIGFVDGYLFFVRINDEEHVGQPAHIANAREVLLQSAVLPLKLKPLFFGKRIEAAICTHRFNVFHSLN
jgi:hypothetical protein